MVKPWLWMPASWAHKMSPMAIRMYAKWHPLQTLTWSPFSWRGIEFNNRLGISGGVDKDAECVEAWWTLGPGFIEVGTITPQPQPGHRGYRVARNNPHQAIWNRLGFPSKGVERASANLKKLYQPRFTPILANIGKNATTPLESAHVDTIQCMRKLRGLADIFVINLSSPNTPKLRDLLKPENLSAFLKPVIEDNRQYKHEAPATPLLLKVSPDLSEDELADIIDTSLNCGIDGWVLTNTSTGLRNGLSFPKEGGVSGKPLAESAKRFLAQTVAHLSDRRQDRLLVSVGGILTPEDVFERLDMGADLAQVYAALVFYGPQFFRDTADAAAIRVQS